MRARGHCSVFVRIVCAASVLIVSNLGVLLNMNHPCEPKSKLSQSVTLASQFVLSSPIFGQCLKIWGVEDASTNNFKRLLR